MNDLSKESQACAKNTHGLLSVKQAAEMLSVCQATIYELCSSRQIEHVRVGAGRGAIRIPRQALDAYLQQKTVQPVSPAAPSVNLKHLKL